MKTVLCIVLIFVINPVLAQNTRLQPGFDKQECIEMLKIAQLQAIDTGGWSKERPVPHPHYYRFAYRSPAMGLQNMWDLWLSKDGHTAVISIRGTDINPNPVSWLANLYAAMVPAKGKLELQHDFTFNYNFSNDTKAAVHVGFLIGTAYLTRDILPKIDSCYTKLHIKNFIIAGHSQGGAICYLVTSHLRSMQTDGSIPADVQFKTYASAAPKAGNLYYAYQYESLTRNWSYNTVNTDDWVPEVPFSVQTVHDFGDVNPFKGADAMIKKQKFIARIAMRHMYNRMRKPSLRAQHNYEKYLGRMVSKMVKKTLPEFNPPSYFKSNDYVRIGTTVVLYADDAYRKKFPTKPDEVWLNHFIDRYIYLVERL